MARRRTFDDVVTEAVADIAVHGFDSQERVDYWLRRIREAAAESLTLAASLESTLKAALRAVYARLVERGGLARYHNGIDRFTIKQLEPKLRAELQRRVMASAQLIRLNRQAAIEKTLQRFSGWSSSIPAGGTKVAGERQEAKDGIRKSLRSLPFDERRVMVDQGHKFTAALSEIVAHDHGAIAAIWHSHWRQSGYNFREDHKERDGQAYAVRGNWAMERGFMRVGDAGYADKITKPGEEVFCRCWYEWVYHLHDLPPAMVTAKGREAMKDVKVA